MLLFPLLFFFASSQSYALDVTLEWDANTQPDLDHYVVFWGTSSGIYTTNSGNIDSQTTYSATGLFDGTTYYFAVKAYDD